MISYQCLDRFHEYFIHTYCIHFRRPQKDVPKRPLSETCQTKRIIYFYVDSYIKGHYVSPLLSTMTWSSISVRILFRNDGYLFARFFSSLYQWTWLIDTSVFINCLKYTWYEYHLSTHFINNEVNDRIHTIERSVPLTLGENRLIQSIWYCNIY